MHIIIHESPLLFYYIISIKLLYTNIANYIFCRPSKLFTYVSLPSKPYKLIDLIKDIYIGYFYATENFIYASFGIICKGQKLVWFFLDKIVHPWLLRCLSFFLEAAQMFREIISKVIRLHKTLNITTFPYYYRDLIYIFKCALFSAYACAKIITTFFYW